MGFGYGYSGYVITENFHITLRQRQIMISGVFSRMQPSTEKKMFSFVHCKTFYNKTDRI